MPAKNEKKLMNRILLANTVKHTGGHLLDF